MNTAIEAAQAKLREMRDPGIKPIRLNSIEKQRPTQRATSVLSWLNAMSACVNMPTGA